jgi:lipopolysaccharide cholinephosphotransferase
MANTYTQEEMKMLHRELYDILAEIIRVCDKHHIPYVIIGGSAIGAFFEQEILPWDDDVDIAIKRDDYNRFLEVAPSELRPDYFLQWLGTEPHTPFYFAKVRKRNTLFVEEMFAQLPIHHGIYIDVFPFDRIPDNLRLRKAQRDVANFFNCCFMGKEVWFWRYFGKPTVPNPTNRGPIPCLMNRIVDTLFTKRFIYRMLCWVQGWFNGCDTEFYNMVLMPKDHIEVVNFDNPVTTQFGPLQVKMSADVETYLRRHYPRLRRYIPEEEQMNHHPAQLSFDTTQKIQ